MKRRLLLGAAGGAAATAAFNAKAQVQTPVRLVVGFQAGGSSDVLARVVAAAVQDLLGRTVVVDNRPGAGGRLAMDVVRNAKPGEEVYAVAPQGSLTLFPYVYKNLRYDPVADFTPVSRLISFDYALTVGPGTHSRTISDYLRWAAATPEKTTYGSAGAGTTPHFVGVAFHRRAGLTATHVAYRGSAQALPDLLSGRIPAMFATLADSLQQHRTGSLRIIGTGGAERSSLLTDVPTFREVGIPLVVPGWAGIYGPKDLSTESLGTLNAALQKALKSPTVISKLLGLLGMIAAPGTPAELALLQKEEHAFWGPVVKESGFAPEE